MRVPRELPPALRRRAFTRAQLIACGLHPDRLRRRDVVPLGAGTYAHTRLVNGADDAMLHRLRSLALAREFPHGWLSHETGAALLDRCAAPASLPLSAVHLSVPHGSPAITRSGVRCHRVQVHESDVMPMPGIAGVRLSAPGLLFRQLSAHCSVGELIGLGDSLVRIPYPWAEQRVDPYTSIAALRAAVEDAGRFRGKRTAAEALELIRVGADSAKETAFRLALLGAGLPEPQLQIALDPADPHSRRGDLGYRQWRLVIQYDGKTHYTEDRHRADQRRDNEWSTAGWLTLRVSVEDDRQGYRFAVGQVAAALRSRGYPSG